jgi:AbiV family abortive infection protein
MLSEDALRGGAVACFTNAQELYEEAKLLLEHARPPRAAALALIGAEEFAQAVVYTVGALLPEQRHRLPARLDSYELKYRICSLADVAQIENSEGWAVAADYGDTTSMSRLGDLFEVLAGWGLDSFLDAKEANEYYRKLRCEHEEQSRHRRHLQADPERDIYLGLREPDLKKAALYVDLDASGKVISPTYQVEEREALRSILSLEYLLKEYAALPMVVADDQHWRDFAERVRHGLCDTDTH